MPKLPRQREWKPLDMAKFKPTPWGAIMTLRVGQKIYVKPEHEPSFRALPGKEFERTYNRKRNLVRITRIK